MKNAEFNAECIKWNKEYKELFGVIPSIRDYACSREEFLDALRKSIETRSPVETYLIKKAMPLNPDALT
ncbi:MAG: hypothetical protein LUF35_08825 [Lachnospiraceae bacterium]|nr:hypothetical protein [Lachnospiraceae bacterium]